MDPSHKFTAQYRRPRQVDDSSSISSMSSSSKGHRCHVCREAETLPTKPLVRCKSCKGRWHPCCHKPTIDYPRTGDFQCTKCTRKMNAAASLSSIPASSNPYTFPSDTNLESSNQPSKMEARHVCQRLTCNNPIYRPGSNGRLLCKRHEVEEKHKSASAPKQGSGFRVSTAPRPFKKKKLYPFKPDEENKLTKRKRSSSKQRIVPPITVGQSLKMQPQGPQPQGLLGDQPRVSSTGPTFQDITMNTTTQGRSPFQGDPRSLNRANMIEDETKPQTSRKVAGPLAELLSTSPEGQPIPGSVINTDINCNHDDSPTSQIAQELKATADKPSVDSNVYTIGESPQTLLSIEPNPFRVQNSERDTQEHLELRREEDAINPVVRDVEMTGYISPYISRQPSSEPTQEAQREYIPPRDPSPIEVPSLETRRDTTIGEGKDDFSVADEDVEMTPAPNPPSPILAPSPPSTTCHHDPVPDIPETEYSYTSMPNSLDAQRQQNAQPYDPSVLDSWLAKQALPDSDSQPTAEELARTQIWGHIDPRVKWPKELSEDWLSAKRKEIQSRSRRKANFGKLLTPQVIKERKEKGWGIHQNKDIVDDEKSAEGARVVEELFGLRDVDDFEPGVRNGRLVMVEKDVDENGRRRRKPRVFTVG